MAGWVRRECGGRWFGGGCVAGLQAGEVGGWEVGRLWVDGGEGGSWAVGWAGGDGDGGEDVEVALRRCSCRWECDGRRCSY